MNIKNMNFSKEEKEEMLKESEKLLRITSTFADVSDNDFMKIKSKIDKLSLITLKVEYDYINNFKNTEKSRDLNIILQQAINFLEEIIGDKYG